ncbi:MAG: light-regulated signal transduction histidine kinase (bacteriophytochrome), partial [Algoriphagus sp.]
KYGHLIDEKGHQYIHYATDGAKRMRRIILDLLDYSRASKSIEEKEDVDINELLSEFSQLRRKIISEKSASISSNNLPILKTGKVAIVQILHCLLDNALMYTEVGTPPIIEINAVENEKEWEFSIKDNGIGIDPQFYDKIFVIFQRLHNSDQYEGTGIGLSIAKKYVEFLRGRIWLNSAPGEGTVFYFTIPKIK